MRADPAGRSIFVGRPTIWSNPFEGRPWIGPARALILYGAWIAGEVGPAVLKAAHFSRDEAIALDRWRSRMLRRLSELRGASLHCACRRGRPSCHAPVLAGAARAA